MSDSGVRLWPRQLLSGLVRGYRLLLKPWVGNVCRFEPSCSAYALQALGRHGAAQGSILIGARIMRCHPGCEGGYDPVPENFRFSGAGLFTGLLAAGRQRPAATPPPIRKIP